MASPHPAAARLKEVVGPRALVDPEVIASFTTDWTGRFVGHSPVVVQPESTEQVAGVIDVCRDLGLSLVPQGGNTGLVGGSIPLEDEVVLSLRALRDIGPVDDAAGQVTAGAGVVLAELQHAAGRAAWSYGVDMASRDSATVGGMVATNAGGVHVIRYGDTRAQVMGLEAVLGTGTVVSHLGGLVKDNTGYHWPGLLCGSEGTLAVVTAARLRLVPPMPFRTAALLGFSAVADALDAAVSVRRSLPSLDACELMLSSGVELVCSVGGLRTPFPDSHSAYLLVEVADRSDPTDALAEAVEAATGVSAVAVAAHPARRAELWRLREDHTLAINTLGPPHKLDVTLPPGSMAEFIDSVPRALASANPDVRTWLFGHVGDGNIHVNVTGLPPEDGMVDEVVLRLVAEHGGSISAEHGIGTAKKEWLALSRTPAEIMLFHSLKDALDPAGILNPNVLLPAGSG